MKKIIILQLTVIASLPLLSFANTITINNTSTNSFNCRTVQQKIGGMMQVDQVQFTLYPQESQFVNIAYGSTYVHRYGSLASACRRNKNGNFIDYYKGVCAKVAAFNLTFKCSKIDDPKTYFYVGVDSGGGVHCANGSCSGKGLKKFSVENSGKGPYTVTATVK